MFGIFAIQGLFNSVMCFISLIRSIFFNITTQTKKTFWIFIQLIISFGNFAIYAALCFISYAGMYGIEIKKIFLGAG
jgi:hypothetical protein